MLFSVYFTLKIIKKRYTKMKKYEARLSLENRDEKTGEWSEKQTYQIEEIENASEAHAIAKELNADPDQAISDATADVFRAMNNAQDYSDVDTLWILEIVEIGEGGAEKVLAECDEWESKLAKRWFNN